jgi:hypothetical protein
LKIYIRNVAFLGMTLKTRLQEEIVMLFDSFC